MRAVDKLAAIAALKAGLTAAEAELKHEVLALADATGARNFAHGIYVARRSAGVQIADDAAFIAWVQQNAPGEIVPTVRDSYRKAIEAQLVQVGDDVVLKGTGEAVDWADVGTDGEPYVGVKLDPQVKAAAVAAVAERIEDYLAMPELPGGAA